MTSVLVLGGGACGLAGAMMLARDGHDVTVLERDSSPVPASPGEAWERWERAGVSQFRLAHYLHARAREVLAAELPEVLDALIAAGGVTIDPSSRMPAGAPAADDDRLTTVTARRTTFEQIVARAAESEPRLEVRRGVAVERLLARDGTGVPHVTGVRTTEGEELRADLVVDAMGRRSRLPEWLREAGAAKPMHEEAEDSGFVYYSRFFHGTMPEPRSGFLTPLGSFSLLTLPSDSGTWSVTVFVAAGDRALKAVRHEDKWEALVRACPFHAHWIDGEPLGGITAMGGVLDRYRRMIVDGRPVATGVVPLADACACTNPSLGRGIALGLSHAALLPGVVRSHLNDPAALVQAWDDATERHLTPWYRATVATDRARLAEIDALRRGLPPAPLEGPAKLAAALGAAMAFDADVYRAYFEILGCLTLPQEVFARPGLVERVLELAAASGPMPSMAPTRDEVLALVA